MDDIVVFCSLFKDVPKWPFVSPAMGPKFSLDKNQMEFVPLGLTEPNQTHV